MQPDNQQPDQNYSQYVVDDSSVNQEETTAKSSKRFSFSKIKNKIINAVTSPYLWGLILVLVITGSIVWFVEQDREEVTNITSQDFAGSSLDEEGFAELAQEQAEIDSTNQTLNVQANSVFDGTMLVRSSLEVQGQLRVGEELTLNDLTVAGQGTINNLDVANDLNVQAAVQLGETTIQDSLTVTDSLNVASGGTFGGSISAQNIEAGNLSFSGDLSMSGRIITGGEQTSSTTTGNIGGGGTASVNGNDTAGTININTGNSPSSGILTNISFGSGYNAIPRVNITPVGSSSGSIDWYIERTNDGFSIGSNSAPSSGANYSFDYFVVQ